mgnify:CR=1 FL=1
MPARRYLAPFFAIVLSGALAGCATLCVHSGDRCGSVDTAPTLRGAVVDPAGEPIPGIAVCAATNRGSVTVVTDCTGRFVVPGIIADPQVILLAGPLGVGRVRIPEAPAEDGLFLTYPVVTEVFLLHDNDLHFDFNYREQFEQAVAWFRNEFANVYLLNAGDIFVRHRSKWPVDALEYYDERSRFIIETMNDIGYDVCTLGNHELDYRGHYTRDSLRLARFPRLGANVDVSTANFDQPAPYVMFETDNGYTMAILGLCSINADPGGIVLRNPADTVHDYLHLRAEHDLFIVLSHLGVRTDRGLAGQFGEIDVIVGGHSHTLLETAEVVNGVLIAQAGGHPHPIEPDRPKYLGVVRIVMENDHVAEKTGEVYQFDELRSDFERIVATYSAAVQAK